MATTPQMHCTLTSFDPHILPEFGGLGKGQHAYCLWPMHDHVKVTALVAVTKYTADIKNDCI